jgi:hexokinase
LFLEFCGYNADFHVCSLIEFYPHFEEILRESLRLVVGAEVEKRVEIGMAHDGSGVGGKPISFSTPTK